MKSIVISAHPDDESIGCGGSLLKKRANGEELYWIIVTNVSERYGFTKERIRQRENEIRQVEEKIGFKKIFDLQLKPGGIDGAAFLTMVPMISKIFYDIKPETIFVMNRSDIHSDHRFTFDAVVACTKSFRYPFIKKVLMYECISETEFAPPLPENCFLPNYFIDISNVMVEKLELCKIYASEFGDHPFPRSIENIKALAHFRGATAGVQYAEAFQLLKYLE